LSLIINAYSIENDKTATVVRVTGHKGFCQVIETGAIDNHLRLANCIDHRSTCRISQNVDLAALGRVSESLTYIAMDNKFARLHDLAKLILRVTMHMDFHSI